MADPPDDQLQAQALLTRSQKAAATRARNRAMLEARAQASLDEEVGM